MSIIAQSDNTAYLDYAAGTPIDPEVFALMVPYFGKEYGNASSMHTSGRRAARAIAEARGKAAAVLGCSPHEVIFTGSGTESDNLALLGAARANRMHGNHLIISAIEHKAVVEAAKQLKREGFEVSVAPVLADGLIDLDAFERLLRSDTILVSVMYANNEIGTVEPIAEVAARIKKYRGQKNFPLLHTDACQAAGFLPLDVAELGVDLMTLNSSKIYGPKGVGLLYKKNDVALMPLVVGGEQEMHLRAGTESVPLIAGFGEALALADSMREIESTRLTALRNYFLEHLQIKIPGAVQNGHRHQRLPNNIHLSIPFVEGEAMLLMLDKAGIEASTGSACSAYDLKPSHVLLAIGQAPELAHGSIRFSLGRNTTKEELDYALSVFPAVVERLTAISASLDKSDLLGKSDLSKLGTKI